MRFHALAVVPVGVLEELSPSRRDHTFEGDRLVVGEQPLGAAHVTGQQVEGVEHRPMRCIRRAKDQTGQELGEHLSVVAAVLRHTEREVIRSPAVTERM